MRSSSSAFPRTRRLATATFAPPHGPGRRRRRLRWLQRGRRRVSRQCTAPAPAASVVACQQSRTNRHRRGSKRMLAKLVLQLSCRVCCQMRRWRESSLMRRCWRGRDDGSRCCSCDRCCRRRRHDVHCTCSASVRRLVKSSQCKITRRVLFIPLLSAYVDDLPIVVECHKILGHEAKC